MKKNILSILAICAALLGCQKNEISETRTSGVELHATIEDDASTKTVMDANNNILWQEGDQIVAFMKSSYRHKYQLLSSYAGKAYADFEPVSSGNGGNLSAGTEWDHNVAYYPYSETVECLKFGSNYVIDVVLPSEQTYAPESFGNGSMAMVAVSEDNNITFRNVLGGMKLQLKGTQTVTSITLQGKNSEKLSGAATVTAYTDEIKPAITMASDASTSVTLNCGSGVQLNETTATEFIIALPPVLFSQGFTVTITDDAGNEQTIETDKENSVLRSSLLVMPEVTLDKVPQTGDYVDEYGIIHGPGVKIGETVWAPVNCGYHATDYKYGKLYQWGRKYGQGYDENDATTPTIEGGGISAIIGQHKSKSNVFFTSLSRLNYDWLSPPDGNLWNSGTEDNPVKTEYDPCPEGWRVPTWLELDELNNNYSSWTTDDNGRSGRWFSGPNSYTASVPQVFFPAAGYRYYSSGGLVSNRGDYGYYWSSRPYSSDAFSLYFNGSDVGMTSFCRAQGYSVRCVQE
ncbi:MAG: hypothetical protein E7123_03120 [Bacteroidales bacterium]|nr:hypothetical protein [Bacteroidales bacterium]